MTSHKDPYTGELNFIERKGLEFLRKNCSHKGEIPDVWNEEQIADIRGIERRAIWFAVASGALSGGVIAGFELGLSSLLIDNAETASWRERIPFWATHLALAGMITVIEIIYLYRIMLKSVARISTVGGLSIADASVEEFIPVGISRAALDMPNPLTKFYGIDPYLRINRWKLMLYTFAYRAKIGVTSIILRLVMRRLLARMALRSFLPFIAIPLYAVWNGVICRWTLREARGRVAAPVAISQIKEYIREMPVDFSRDEKWLLISLVAETIMRARDSHPNFLLLLKNLFSQFEMDPDTKNKVFDWKTCCERLAALDTQNQTLALHLLQAAVVLGGRPRRRQYRLVKEAFDACGRTFDAYALKEVYDQFIRGQGIAGLK